MKKREKNYFFFSFSIKLKQNNIKQLNSAKPAQPSLTFSC